MKSRRWPILVLGAAIGTIMALVLAALLWPAPDPTPTDATIEIFVVDALTNAPITATITFRRETPDGTPIAPEDGETYQAQHASVRVPVDGNILRILVEAPGYQDVDLGLRLNKPGYFGGPIPLKRWEAPPPTPEGPGAS